MTIHKFAINTGQVDPDTFNTILATNRSDIEQRHTPVAIHDNQSADIRMARSQVREMIQVSGAEVTIYLRTDNADFDNVWDEDADPTYWNPIKIKGYFKPQPLEAELKIWGAEIINKTEVIFDHHEINNLVGERMLRAGDVVQLPYNAATVATSPRNYRILNTTPSGNFRYTWLYLTCQMETLTADITVRPEEDLQDDEQVVTGGQYRESS